MVWVDYYINNRSLAKWLPGGKEMVVLERADGMSDDAWQILAVAVIRRDVQRLMQELRCRAQIVCMNSEWYRVYFNLEEVQNDEDIS